MSDLISRKAVLEEIQKIECEPDYQHVGEDWAVGLIIAENIVENAESIESTPSAEPERKIIYCKDCKFAHLTTKGEMKYCDVWFPETKMYLSADDFCSSAEKRGE